MKVIIDDGKYCVDVMYYVFLFPAPRPALECEFIGYLYLSIRRSISAIGYP